MVYDAVQQVINNIKCIDMSVRIMCIKWVIEINQTLSNLLLDYYFFFFQFKFPFFSWFSSSRNSWPYLTRDSPTNKPFVYIFSGYCIFVEVTQSARGFPRVHHDGYSFGLVNSLHLNRETVVWNCTGSEPGTRRRCTATVVTKVIDGYYMMNERNTNHICAKTAVLNEGFITMKW